MVLSRSLRLTIALAAGAMASLAGSAVRANTPTAAQALSLTPIQPNVAYSKPSKEELPQCTIRAEKQGNTTAWVVRSPRGEILRRFADTNGDNVVDMWCYYNDGLESYRDIDSDFNKKADQYRWFNMSGTRWGIDKNEDGKIDQWKVISAPEVAEELVWALKTRDRARFELLLLTPAEMNEAGFGGPQAEKISTALKAAPAGFAKLVAEQKTVTPQTEFADFYRTRPATLPAGTEGSTKDITIHDNASALIENGDKPEQIFLGTLVCVGPTWKLIDVPSIGNTGHPTFGLLNPEIPAGEEPQVPNGAGPPAEMQALMEQLDKLDRVADQLPIDKQGPNTDARVEILRKMVAISVDAEMREAWVRQLADVLSSATQTGNYPQGIKQLDDFAKQLSEKSPNDPLLPYVAFRKMWAEYVLSQQAQDADFGKIQEKWLADLEAFAKQYPNSPDSAEALLQLGMSHEFGGRLDPAKQWYQKLVTDFPQTTQASKAQGALRRLSSVGRPIPFKAQDIRRNPIDLASRDFRGRVVVIQYWAPWYDRAKQDMDALKELYAKFGGRGGLEIISVCLDSSPQEMQRFLAQNNYPWRHVHEPDGFDGRLANEMGVMTLPLMVLVDTKGNVVQNNIFVAELEPELRKQLTTATAQGAAGRNGR